ncbi:MAG: hypothetical protein RL136_2400 [Planctomycetota bacterium]|jgi:hypothetical protein
MHQSLSSASIAPARPRLRAISPTHRDRALIAVVRTQPELPSLAGARLAAALRARGDEVRMTELDGRDLLALPRLGHDVDLVAIVDADDAVRVFPASRGVDLATGRFGTDLVPDFTDHPHERTRVLPIEASPRGERRPLGALLHEVREYMRRYATPDLVFTDHALNACPALYEGLVGAIQRHAHGIQWMAALTVGATAQDGLSRRLLRASAASGLRSVVFRADTEMHGASAEARAQELAGYAADAGVLTRIVVAEPSPATRHANLRAAIRGTAADSIGGRIDLFSSIALKD